jgi:hypothetical protein
LRLALRIFSLLNATSSVLLFPPLLLLLAKLSVIPVQHVFPTPSALEAVLLMIPRLFGSLNKLILTRPFALPNRLLSPRRLPLTPLLYRLAFVLLFRLLHLPPLVVLHVVTASLSRPWHLALGMSTLLHLALLLLLL